MDTEEKNYNSSFLKYYIHRQLPRIIINLIICIILVLVCNNLSNLLILRGIYYALTFISFTSLTLLLLGVGYQKSKLTISDKNLNYICYKYFKRVKKEDNSIDSGYAFENYSIQDIKYIKETFRKIIIKGKIIYNYNNDLHPEINDCQNLEIISIPNIFNNNNEIINNLKK